ncbi:MAG: DoxX family protein [Azospira oryzae]|nr:MAG: DoxX family protein [Azospira oryzae]
MKVAQAEVSVKGSTDLGWPAEQVQTIGILLTIFTILYMIPRTAILGAVLITAYLGGAVAVMLRAGQFNPFPIVFGIVVWGALYLLDARVRSVIPLRKAE